MPKDDIEIRFYALFCPYDADSDMLEDIENWIDNNGVIGMEKAIKWFYNGGQQDFYIMIQNI